MEIFTFLCGLCLGLIPFVIKKQYVKKKNQELEKEEADLIAKIADQRQTYFSEKDMYEKHQIELKKRLDIEHKEILQSHTKELSLIEDQKKALQDSYEKQKELAEQNFEFQLEQIGKKYQEDEEKCRQEYLKVIEDYKNSAAMSIRKIDEEVIAASAKLVDLKQKIDIATENAKKEQEKQQQIDFYRMNLPATDIEEIQKLREVTSQLRDKDAINKVIWKVYYEKPCTAMIGRVVGAKVVTGIYKITNLQNQMTYVGQSVSIGDRWKQHIKRGVGAESATRNKLYPAMMEFGAENFTFEIIEECEPSKLDEREKFWQNYYNSLTYGYSMR